jgi:hypothetical protein
LRSTTWVLCRLRCQFATKDFASQSVGRALRSKSRTSGIEDVAAASSVRAATSP